MATIKWRRKFGELKVGERFRLSGHSWQYEKTADTAAIAVAYGFPLFRKAEDLVLLVPPKRPPTIKASALPEHLRKFLPASQ
jgi:hypothetical protein